MQQIASKFRRSDGAEIAEAAMVLPLAFMFLLGIIWFGRAFNIYSTIQQAAQQGAITAARSTCGTCSPFPNSPATPTAVTNVVEGVMRASNVDPSQIANSGSVSPVSCLNPAAMATCSQHDKITVCQQVLLNSTTQTPQCGTMVTFQFPFSFYLPYTSLNLQTITMSAQGQSRMEN